MKKTLAILLSLALVVCMIPAAGASVAFAEGVTGTNTLTADMVGLTGGNEALYSGTNTFPAVTVTVNGNSVAADGNWSGTWKNAGGENVATEANQLNAGVYSLTVTSIAGTTFKDVQSVTKTYTVKQVNLENATVECSPLKVSDFTGKTWASITQGQTIQSLPDGKTITVKVGSDTVATSLYKTEIVKKNDYQIQVKVSAADGQDSQNVTGTKYATFDVTTELTDSAYKVVGTSDCKAIPDATYTGSALTPTVYVVPKDASTIQNKLTEGTDYKVSYSSNIAGNSDATVTITGMNKYSGTITGTFHINGKQISSCSMTVGNTVQNKKPEVKLYDGSKKLVEGTDYETITDSNYNTNAIGASAGTVTVTGKGNYAGTKATNFKVVAAANDITKVAVYKGDTLLNSASTLSSAYNYYTGSSLPASNIKVYSSYPNTLVSSNNYDIVYEYAGTNGSTLSTTSPVDAKTYTVYVVGKNDYADKQQIGIYTILQHKMSKTDLTISVSMASATADPVVTVTSAYYKNTSFKRGTDYTVYASSYSYNNKRTVTITSTGTGNLAAGTISDSYPIVSKAISSCSVSLSKSSMPYTGYAITPSVTVKDGNTTLVENTNYTVSYKDSAGKAVTTIKSAGTYTVVVTGMNGYTGSTSLTFTVTGNSISSYTVVLDKTSYTANGSNITLPKVTKVYSGSSTLTSSDYSVTYQNAAGTTVTTVKAPGNYKVVVTGAGKYTGTTYATFTVTGKTNTISGVKSVYKTYADSDQLELYPTATKGKITYSSSDSSIASVSSYGTVTPLKAGRVRITITAAGDDTYEQATKSVVIKVYPARASLTQKPWTAGKGKVKVRWDKQDNVTYYQIKYSRDKKFSSGTYKVTKRDAAQNDYDTQSTTIKNLKSGSRYYFKVRAVKEVYNENGKKFTYYGSWSSWKSVKTK